MKIKNHTSTSKNDKHQKKQNPKKRIFSLKKRNKPKKASTFTFFKNFSIGAKYLSIFTVSVVLFLIAVGLVFFQLHKAQENVSVIVKENQLTNDMAQMALLFEQQNSLISDYIITDNEQKIKEFEGLNDELDSVFDRLSAQLANDEDSLTKLTRIKDKNEKIQTLFMDEIADANADENSIVYAQIQISSQKTSNVGMINKLIDTVNEQQTESVNRVEENMDQSIIILTTASIFSVLIGSIIMVIISRIISRHLKKVVSITSNIAKGNLAVEKIDYKGKDEIGQLSSAVNVLSENIRNMVGKVFNAGKSVSNSSHHLSASSKEVKEGTNQMVITMEELATGAESQATSAADLSEKMHYFLESVQVSQREGQEIANSSHEVLALTENGTKLMQESVKQMSQIDYIVSNAVDQVRGLDAQSDQISKLVEVIKDIADQTNLLALNAAIEAARAGEHGKGFAVVADEVRKLAEQVTNSITEITGIVSSIQAETGDVVSSLNQDYEEVKTGIHHIEKTGKNFDTINESISKMVEGIRQVANRLREIAGNSKQMNGLIEDIAAVSEEAAAGIEQSSASTQETSSSMDQITDNAVELDELAEQLNQEVAAFQLK